LTEDQQDAQGPGGTSADALETVRTWLGGQNTPGEMAARWQVRPYRDAWWVAPDPRTRGDSAYLVRRGTVWPVLSNGRTTAARSYEELIARQG
jgi:hypothetical protein